MVAGRKTRILAGLAGALLASCPSSSFAGLLSGGTTVIPSSPTTLPQTPSVPQVPSTTTTPTAGGVTDTLGSTVGGVTTTIGSTSGSLGSAVGSTTGTVGSAIGSTTTTVGSTVTDVGSSVGSTVGGATATVGSTVSDTGSAVGGAVSGTGSTVGGALSGAGSAAGQTIGGVTGAATQSVGSLGSAVGQSGSGSPLGGLTNSIGGVASVLPGAATSLSNVDAAGRPFDPKALSFDPQGRKIVRGEILAIEPTARDLAAARQLNFAIKQRDMLQTLGFEAVTLLAPTNVDAIAALAALRAADPSGTFDFDHIYDPSGTARKNAPPAQAGASDTPVAKSVAVGMIDAGIDTTHPAFANSIVVAANVTGANGYEPTAHGTAVASLLVGNASDFHGQLPGARLYAADAFGGAATGGSALDIARALDWLAKNHVVVANASLAGPPNALLEAAVKAFLAKGHVLVAAAGNQGPAAPPAYPAAYHGVIGVTSVDERHHLQYDANRGDVAFAATGVGVRAASLNRGYDVYTGTSFAAPVVAAHFALLVPSPDAEVAEEARENLARQAQVLGDRAAYGYGYVAPVSLNAATQ